MDSARNGGCGGLPVSFGPSLEILVQAMEEDEAGQEVPLETSISCLLMDFSWAVLPGLREFDPVTEGDGIQCFLEGSPHLVPFSSSLLSLAYEWMIKEGAPARVQFYSAEEEKGASSVLQAKGKKKAVPPAKPEISLKAKKPTIAALAEQISMLSKTIPEMAAQLKALQEKQQQRFEGSVAASHEALRTPAHRQLFQASPSKNPAELIDFAKKVGLPPRTKPPGMSTVTTPMPGGLLPEDERRVDAQEMAARLEEGTTAPTFGAALMQQSQAMNALVAHLIGQQDPMMELGSGGGLAMSLSSKGTKGRERLMQELANKNGTFFLQVAQNAFRRLRPAEVTPKLLADFPRKAFFSKYMERQGGFAGQRDLGLTMWLLCQVADAMLCQEPQHAQDLLALTLVTLKQVVQDGGKWELGFLLSLQEDPPSSVFTAKASSTNPRMRAFAPLCPQPWATVRGVIQFHQKTQPECHRGRDPKACTKEEAEIPEKTQASRVRFEVEDDSFGSEAVAGGDGNVPEAAVDDSACVPPPPCQGKKEDGFSEEACFCSGARPCQAAEPEDSEISAPTWRSLQSYSFDQWCSSLMRKALGSGTKFGAFLHATSQVARAGRPVSAKAIFPLPVPAPGVFGFEGGHPSLRKRHKRYREQAFHVVVMALNFLHADCQFVNLKLLARPPNSVQEETLNNLKRIFLAFGHAAGEISVPASGRRCTSLVSLLADLSEFLTKEGIADSAYQRGFSGEASNGSVPSSGFPEAEGEGGERSPYFPAGVKVPRDMDRAPELVPYRDLDPSRLKLHGKAQWDPSRFLDDALWMAFKEPGSLCWTSDFNFDDIPDLDREDPNQVLNLAKVWDVNGLLHLAPAVLEKKLVPSYGRGRNQTEAYLPGPSRYLPCGYHLGVLEVDPKKETVCTCISDRRDFYHQIAVSDQRAASNRLWPPLPADQLEKTIAYAKFVANKGSKKRAERIIGGDRFADLFKENEPLIDLPTDKEMLFCCFGSVIQGDHLGVEIATKGHRGLLEEGGLLEPGEELLSCKPFAGEKTLQGLVIDDFFCLSIEKDKELKKGATPISKKRFLQAQSIYKEAELIGSSDKDVVNEKKAKIAGAELDSGPYSKALGVIPLGAPSSKRLALSFLSLELCNLGWSTDALHSCLTGGWTSCLMFRRPLMSIFDKVYHCCDMASVDQLNPKLIKLDRKVKEELTLIAVLAPMVCTDLAARTIPKAFATDASDRKGAYVSADIPEVLAKMMWRTGRRKGGYTRMLSRERALLSKIDEFFEERADEGADAIKGPEKPLAFRYHFVEICGGAGKIAKEMAKRGWTVGPVVDLDRSPHFDLQLLRVLSWLLFMLENNRLESFLVAPPCTTFTSPAPKPPKLRPTKGVRPHGA